MSYRIVKYEPTKRMLKAASRSMSPKYRPTEEWVSNSVKHAIRYKAMIDAESTGFVGFLNKILKRL